MSETSGQQEISEKTKKVYAQECLRHVRADIARLAPMARKMMSAIEDDDLDDDELYLIADELYGDMIALLGTAHLWPECAVKRSKRKRAALCKKYKQISFIFC